jgi:bifunctional non-homologous end joining protein LigD
MNNSTISITSTSLHFREGNSDKEYHAAVEPEGEGYIVTFAYGRRGGNLTTGRKTQNIVTLAEANAIHAKLIREKTAKGYREVGETRQPDRTSDNDGQDSGIRCQLLNPVEETELDRLLGNGTHCLQEKHDGRRLMVRKKGDEITGINRRGLLIPVPETIRRAVAEIPVDVLIDGEVVGDTLHAFDLLEVKGYDIRANAYLSRMAGLIALLDPEHKHLRPVNTHMEPDDKRAMFETFRRCGSEGVVFKEIDSPFSPGRPNSGGSQLKFKFVESASFIVTGHNTKRSVNLGLMASDGNGIVPAGNVTIPPNQRIPAVGAVADCRYLYSFRESGSIYQPVYLGEREDIPAEDCTTAQLKYKAEPTSVAA